MSNNVVGGVYQSIIEEVMNTSRVDFEENGVEESVLEDLCKVRRDKFSSLFLCFLSASFPHSEEVLSSQLRLIWVFISIHMFI